MFDTSVKELTKLGMTEYEARAYASLVGLGEGSARQVHEASGVPRPRVYDILESLERKGFVEVWQGQPKSFRAVEPDRLMRILREDLEESMRIASSELSNLSLEAKKRTFPVWHIKGQGSIRDQVRTMMSSTKKEIIIILTRTSTMRSLSKELLTVADRAEVACMVPEGAESLQKVLPGIRVMEPLLAKDPLSKEYRRIFKGKFEAGEEHYRPELLMVVDGLRSLLVYEVNGERTAIVFELPLITQLQRNAMLRLMETSTA